MSIKRLILILSVFLVLFAVFVSVLILYNKTDMNLFYTADGDFLYNGIFFEDGEKAKIYRPLSRGFEDFDKIKIDLSEYGFEGKSAEYFLIDGIAYTENEGTWPVCHENKFIYTDDDAKNYIIDVDRKKSYPVFSGSQTELDEYGTGKLWFSPNAHYAISLVGDIAALYISDNDPENFKIDEIKKIDLSEYGEKFTFGGFVGKSEGYFCGESDGKKIFLALDASKGEIALSRLDPSKEYGDIINRIYIERIEKNEDHKKILAWSDILLGTEYKVSLPETGFESAYLMNVSGEYAAIASGGKIYIAKNKKYAEIPLDGKKAEKIIFIRDNIISVLYDGKMESYKVCF